MEGTLATDKLLARIENETTSSAEVVRMKKAVDLIKSFSDGLGFCLTADGDKLSQWRGYADDGHGFSIGFSKKYLTDKTKSNGTSHITKFFFEQVRYENKVFQSQEIDSIFDLLKNKNSIDLDRSSGGFIELAMRLMRSRFIIKNDAFKEEEEWRLFVCAINSDESPPEIKFRSSAQSLIPYTEMKLDSSENIIEKVVIGPKNKTPEYAVRSFLAQNNFSSVDVIRSEASYR
jgi:hypothetical protein